MERGQRWHPSSTPTHIFYLLQHHSGRAKVCSMPRVLLSLSVKGEGGFGWGELWAPLPDSMRIWAAGVSPLCSSQQLLRHQGPPKHLQLVPAVLRMLKRAPGIGKGICDSIQGRCGAWGQRGVITAKTASREPGIFLHLLHLLTHPISF